MNASPGSGINLGVVVTGGWGIAAYGMPPDMVPRNPWDPFQPAPVPGPLGSPILGGYPVEVMPAWASAEIERLRGEVNRLTRELAAKTNRPEIPESSRRRRFRARGNVPR